MAPTDTSAKAFFKRIKADEEAHRKEIKADLPAERSAKIEVQAEVEELRAKQEELSRKSEDLRVEAEKVRTRLRELDGGA